MSGVYDWCLSRAEAQKRREFLEIVYCDRYILKPLIYSMNTPSNTVKDLPNHWKINKFVDVLDIVIGGTPKRSESKYWDKEKVTSNLWVSISDMNQKIVLDTKEYISDLGVKKSNVKLIPPNTILLSFKLTLGKISISGKSLYTNEAIAALIIKHNSIFPDFLYQALQIINFENEVDTAIKGKTLNKQKLARIQIVLPPLPEQKKIAAILSSVDRVIETTQDAIAQLQIVKRGLTQQLLTKGIPGWHKEYKWEYKKLNYLSKKITDGSHQAVKTSNLGTIPFLYVSCIRNGKILWHQSAKITEKTYLEISKGREIKPGVILYTAVGSYGEATLMDNDKPLAFQRHIAYIVPDSNKIEPKFLVHWLNSPNGKFQADKVAVGNAQKTVTLTELSNFIVPVPPLPEQEKIANILTSIDKRIEAEEAKKAQVEIIKKGLMQQLLTGKIRVKLSSD